MLVHYPKVAVVHRILGSNGLVELLMPVTRQQIELNYKASFLCLILPHTKRERQLLLVYKQKSFNARVLVHRHRSEQIHGRNLGS